MDCWALMLAIQTFVLAVQTNAFYVPLRGPVTYCEDAKICKSKIPVYVNRLDSPESVMPFEYSHFDFCSSREDAPDYTENLGQVVFGERIRPSPYELYFNKNETCKVACTKTYKDKSSQYDKKKLKFLSKGILLNYQHNWIIDDLPVAWCYQVESDGEYCAIGFPIGCYVDKEKKPKDACVISNVYSEASTFYVFNYIKLTVAYHPLPKGDDTSFTSAQFDHDGRILSIKVEPMSIDIAIDPKDQNLCTLQQGTASFKQPGENADNFAITYAYGVTFVENKDIKWSSRWDYILGSMSHTNIQWFSIINSAILVLFLTGMLSLVLLRKVCKHGDQMTEGEFAWRLVYGDVFRSPAHEVLLAALVGSGTQIGLTSLVTLILACFGLLFPGNRGALIKCIIVAYSISGLSAGYMSASLYKIMEGEKWKTNVLVTCLLCPAVVFALFFICNLISWICGSSAAMPFTTFLVLLVIWLIGCVPLVFFGAYLGFRYSTFEQLICTNQIPRQIPQQSVFVKPISSIVLGGILPFGCIFIQLFFILNSIWSQQLYYVYGFLFIVFVILFITCAEVAIILCYFHLCAEDYRWWWRSFMTSGSVTIFSCIYSVYYYIVYTNYMGFVNAVLYFGYTAMIMWCLFLFTGTIGFLACLLFIRKIYSMPS